MSHHYQPLDQQPATDHGNGSERRLLWALLLTGTFMIVEAAGGIISGSLALLADAGHMLVDTAALALAWFAVHLGHRPADPRRSYGYHRAQVLAAFVNGVVLVGITVWILAEAVQRLLDPVPVLGGLMLAVAVLGLMVNIAAFAILHNRDDTNLNLRAATLHVFGDLLGSVGAITAAGVILWTGWTPIDPILSVLVAALILRGAWKIIRHSGHILLEGAPEDIDEAEVRATVTENVPGVSDVHHVHAWSLTPERPLLTLHARIEDGTDQEMVLRQIKCVLAERFAIGHATIQLERETCPDTPPGHPGHAGA